MRKPRFQPNDDPVGNPGQTNQDDRGNQDDPDAGVDVIRFKEPDLDSVIERMRSLAESRDGWINFQPVLEDESGGSPAEMPPVRAGVIGLFSSKGPPIPVSTWVPGVNKRRGTDPDSLGIQHGAGPKAANRLREAGITAPDGWRVLADHPKRGLVVQLPKDTDPAVVLKWLIRASRELSKVRLPDTWAAVVHNG